MITFTEIISCNGTVVYEAVNKEMNFFTSGKLEILLAYDGMLLLRLNNFEYPINGEQTILYDKTDPQFSLVLYLRKYPKDQWVIKTNEDTDALFSCLEEKSYMKDKNQKGSDKHAKETAKPLMTVEKNKEFYLGDEEEDMGQIREKKEEQSAFIEVSKHANKGLKFAGGLLSKGIDNLGGFISKRVEKKEDTHISASTKENLELAKKTTGNVLNFASEAVGTLFTYGKKVANDVGDRFESSDKGKEVMEHKHYQTVKNGAKVGVGVAANIYDGVVDAVYSVGSGVAKGAGKVVGAKYGSEAADATDGVLEGAGNAIKIMRVPADQIANTLKE